jgi:hypothetical protein
MKTQDAVNWAVSRWEAEVKNRPLQNIHRRSLDDTWRQVIRRFGGDDVGLCGLSHDDLLAAQPKPEAVEPTPIGGGHYDSQGYCDNPGRGY